MKVYLALPITVEQGTDWKSLVFSGDSIRKTSIPLLKSKINILIRCLELLKQGRISFDNTCQHCSSKSLCVGWNSMVNNGALPCLH